MRSVLKALFYAALLCVCYWCGYGAFRDYSLLMMDDGDDLRRATRLKGTKSTNAPPITATNSVTTATTNSVTNLTSATKPPAVTEDPEEAPATHAGRRVGRSYFRIVGNTVGLAAALVGSVTPRILP